MSDLKRVILGQPLASHDEQHQRLSKKIALPVFASDDHYGDGCWDDLERRCDKPGDCGDERQQGRG